MLCPDPLASHCQRPRLYRNRSEATLPGFDGLKLKVVSEKLKIYFSAKKIRDGDR